MLGSGFVACFALRASSFEYVFGCLMELWYYDKLWYKGALGTCARLLGHSASLLAWKGGAKFALPDRALSISLGLEADRRCPVELRDVRDRRSWCNRLDGVNSQRNCVESVLKMPWTLLPSSLPVDRRARAQLPTGKENCNEPAERICISPRPCHR